MAFAFSVSRTAELLTEWGLKPTTTATGLVLEGPDGSTELVVQPLVDVTALDGIRIQEVVRVVHELPHLDEELDSLFAAQWNRYSALTCLIGSNPARHPLLFSKFPLLAGDPGAAETIYPFLAAASAYNMAGVANYLGPGEPSARSFRR
jgi:hypothetical protein